MKTMKVKNIGSNMTELQLADGTLVLVSYETPVAAFVPGLAAVGIHDQPVVRTNKNWSATTSRHIHKWLNQNFHCQPYREMPQSFFDNLLKPNF